MSNVLSIALSSALSGGLPPQDNAMRQWDLPSLARPAVRALRSASGMPPEPPSNPAEAAAEAANAALDEAERVLDQAQESAAITLREAREEAARVLEEARLQGLEEGRAEAQRAVDAQLQQLAALQAGMEDAFKQFCRQQIPQLAGLSVLAAERLMCAQLTLEPERVTAIAHEALEHLTGSRKIALWAHPEDVALLAQCPTLRAEQDGGRVELIADAEMERGGCRLSSEQGEVDATLGRRLTRLQEEFHGDSGS